MQLPKKRTKFFPSFKGRILSDISFIFWEMEFQEKLPLRFTDFSSKQTAIYKAE
jgi:hypothetical protein